MNIELKHLRTLTALRDQGNLAKAADHLHLTQSALSHQIKELEQRLAVNLFHRQGRSLRFTHAGSYLLSLADRILPQMDLAAHELQRMGAGESGRLYIALECHSCFEWLMPTLDNYRQHWPKVEMDLTLAHSFEPLVALTRGDIDMVITSDPTNYPELQFFALFQYQAVLVMACDHPLAKKDFIVPEDLRLETLITYPVDRQRLDIYRHFLDPAHVIPAARRQAELTVMILQLVASRRGVAALPHWAAHQQIAQGQLVAKPLGEAGYWATLYCGVRASDAHAAYFQSFIDTARAVSAQSLNGIKIISA